MSAGAPLSSSERAAEHLGREDWLAAGLRLLLEEGEEAVRITRLAEALHVTRGSFYWHFKDRAALLEGLVGIWSERNTAAILEAVAGAVSLAHGILALFETWIEPARFDPRLDQAMRDWARRAPAIRAAVEAADEARVAAVAALFRRFGFTEPEAFIRARVVYFTQVGYHALEIREPLAERISYLEAYYRAFTGRPLAPRTAETFRRRHGASAEAS